MPFANLLDKLKERTTHTNGHGHDESPRSSGEFDSATIDAPSVSNLADSDAWLQGSENHLTPDQDRAFQHFKHRLQQERLWAPATPTKPATADDATLLRFLRARRFDVDGGLKQFQETEQWRKDNSIDQLYATFDIDAYEESRRMYPQWTGRRDRRGIPIYVFNVKHLNSKNMAIYSEKTENEPVGIAPAAAGNSRATTPKRLLRLFALYENMLQFVGPLCSALPRPHPEAQIVATTNPIIPKQNS
ncbi:hypothetical protein KEM52_004354, partial [Ascosphaera acerosa]